MGVFWRRQEDEKSYEIDLDDLTQTQLLRQILLTLERMEAILASIEQKGGPHDEELEEIARRTAEAIDTNTALLSQISLGVPVPGPRGRI